MIAQLANGTRAWSDQRACSLLGTGSALPGEPVTTEALLACIDKNFAVDIGRCGLAMARKLGIQSRHVCRDLVQRSEQARAGDANADLAARAVSAALQDAGLGVEDLSYLIGHTCTPSHAVPPNISEVADRLKYTGPYLELRQACTGFANALITALGLLDAPGCGPVAIVGSETGSLYFDPLRAMAEHGQLVNLLQMGDAAAACVIANAACAGAGTLSHVFFGQRSVGRLPGFARADGGSEYRHDFAAVKAHGPELFRLGLGVARASGIETKTLDHIIPHQVSGRIAEHLAKILDLPKAQFYTNADRCGNTGSAAIWLALAQLKPQLQRGSRVLALGAEATKYMYGGFLYAHG